MGPPSLLVCLVGFFDDDPPPNFWPGGVREPGAVPAMPGRGTEPPPLIGGLSFPEAWRGSCCTGLDLCAPDVGVAGTGGIFLLCRDSAAGGRWVLRVLVPAMPGLGMEPPPFTGDLPFLEAWRGSCCTGLDLCAPDVGMAEVGGLFLLCRGTETEGRWVLRVPIPAMPG